MPAKSEAQRKAAGATLAAKRGGGKAKGASKSMMSMSEEQLKDFAKKRKPRSKK